MNMGDLKERGVIFSGENLLCVIIIYMNEEAFLD